MTKEIVSRRGFLGQMALAGAALSLTRAPQVAGGGGWLVSVEAAPVDLLHDTYNGLLAFVVPGRDRYSVAQALSTTELGGVDAGATETLIATVDGSTPFVPGFSTLVAQILNDIARAVHPGITGPFQSPFANLSHPEKAVVFQVMDADERFKVLAGVLPGFVAFFVYSEAGAFDPVTGTITGRPLGWKLSNYQGVSDGRDEFRGYFRGRD